ncbi:MAG TPA: hypothetical protein EYG92_00560 [Lutibacter sp.]|nr:hypothetical protein [Lutibacter sp.]
MKLAQTKYHTTKTLLSLFLVLGLVFTLQAQEETLSTEEIQQGVGELQNQVKSLMNFYQKYDEKTTDAAKKDAYNKAIDNLDTQGEATQKDKEDAFKIIDAYIKADKAASKPQKPKKQVALKDHPEIKRQAQAQFDAALKNLMSMSYNEYEEHVWKTSPMATRREVKESYNQLHKDDSRSVSISAADDEPTKTQREVNAYFQMENAKTYKEYRDAIKILNPALTDEQIQRGWGNR